MDPNRNNHNNPHKDLYGGRRVMRTTNDMDNDSDDSIDAENHNGTVMMPRRDGSNNNNNNTTRRRNSLPIVPYTAFLPSMMRSQQQQQQDELLRTINSDIHDFMMGNSNNNNRVPVLPRLMRVDGNDGDHHRRFSYPFRSERSVLSILDEVLDLVGEDSDQDLALFSSMDKHHRYPPRRRGGRE